MTKPERLSEMCVNTGLRLNASNRFTSLELWTSSGDIELLNSEGDAYRTLASHWPNTKRFTFKTNEYNYMTERSLSIRVVEHGGTARGNSNILIMSSLAPNQRFTAINAKYPFTFVYCLLKKSV